MDTAHARRSPAGQRVPPAHCPPECSMKVQARRKATHGKAETRGGFGADSREEQEKNERSSQLHAVCPRLQAPSQHPPRVPALHARLPRNLGTHLLPCGPQDPLGSLFLQLLIIHSCVQTFIQQTFIENGFWQESRFHLALEPGCQDIALRK